VADARFLANGTYTVLVTAEGTGASSWDRYALTGFAADPVEDRDGLFVYLRDPDSGELWSAGRQPVPIDDDAYEVTWSAGKVAFRRECHGIRTDLEICVAPQDALEIRRVSILNCSPKRRASSRPRSPRSC
jgi:cyclic beta-1,2-glucan synthetase